MLAALPAAEIIARLEARKVPVGTIHDTAQVFASDQAKDRDMVVEMPGPNGTIRLIGNPLKLSRTPVRYDLTPPHCGADTEAILNAVKQLPATSR